MVRPPAAKCAAMGRAVDAPGQATDDAEARAGQSAGQPLRLSQAVLAAMARADDADRQGIVRHQSAAHEQHARRIVDLAERPRIGGVALGEDVDAVFAAQGDLGFDVDFLLGLGNLLRELWANALQSAKLAGCGREHGPRRAEPLHERLANPRPHAGDQTKP